MPDSSKNPTEWGDHYRKRFALYSDATHRLKTLVQDLLVQAGISVVQIECRPKTVESFVEKVARKSAQYVEPLEEITDLAGIRVITYYLEDVTSVGNLIQAEFDVDRENSVDKTSALDPMEFGYTGVHYVVRLGAARRALPEWAGVTGLRAEVQIRTAAQHAWAAVDHKLNYKSNHEIPDGLRRRFYRLSALFELADDQFSVLRLEHERLERGYSEALRRGELDIALDSASLEPYLERNPRIQKLVAKAVDIGWEFGAPEEHPERAARDRRDLLTVLDVTKLVTIEQLDDVLADEEKLHDILSIYRRQWGELNFEILLDDLLTAVVIMLTDVEKSVVEALYSKGYALKIFDTEAELEGLNH
jgi:putative GTP pyrophosphokinase